MTQRAIVLVGPMGVGKSSLGRKLAKALGTTFVDTDVEVSRQHGPIPEIFASVGEQAFREYEREAVAQAIASGGVVALGGGAVLSAETRALLAEQIVLFLDGDAAVIAGRIGRGAGRPLLEGEQSPMQRWQHIRDARLPLYEAVAHARFDTTRGHISHIVSAMAEWVEKEQK